jgi:Protein of unknown function (DUF3515)
MDRSTRQATIWATVVSLPIAVLVLLFLFSKLAPPADDPPASSAAPSAQSTAPVEMAAPALSDRSATVCRALLSMLPDRLGDRAQRPVTAGPEQNAAYGDPPVTVACGVTPASYPLTDEVWSTKGVCWHLSKEAASGAAVWETVDREVAVKVTTPSVYDPQVAVAFAAPIASSVKRLADPPSGCP